VTYILNFCAAVISVETVKLGTSNFRVLIDTEEY